MMIDGMNQFPAQTYFYQRTLLEAKKYLQTEDLAYTLAAYNNMLPSQVGAMGKFLGKTRKKRPQEKGKC